MQASDNHQNTLQPFLLEEPNIRGRMVYIGDVANTIISQHDTPPVVSHLLGEALVLTSLLAGTLKYEGIFTFQIKGNGAVPTLVCDLTHDGALRGYAAFDHEKLEETLSAHDKPTAKQMIGDGYLAFTVDQDNQAERYQGMVEMHGETMSEWVRHYFTQSEQIKTALSTFVRYDDAQGWHAAALMLQSLPERAKEDTHLKANAETDSWRRIMMLMDTATDDEMLSSDIAITDMLFRLFHEETVRVFDPLPLRHECRCSLEKIEQILITLSPDEISDYTVDGMVDITCQFCSKEYLFSPEDIARLQQERS